MLPDQCNGKVAVAVAKVVKKYELHCGVPPASEICVERRLRMLPPRPGSVHESPYAYTSVSRFVDRATETISNTLASPTCALRGFFLMAW